ncbi:RDD family protein [Campylobacter concisus]|uniref:RDD family protein n=1 Tax=Campylobacter concisus TaxID=199 RepID=UPI0018A9C6A9|nr:RDD family protein [Campylobacter concisus]QPH98666.1 RDD family protein [Campylobacter concisus]QPI00421.1 RDD family protein [Campylobacter concisus]
MAKQKAKIAPIWARAKAFIIDLFIIGMPIFYATTYLVLDGKEAFLHNQIAIFGANSLISLIMCLFFSIKAQTPGYKAQEIYLINLKTGRKLSFFHTILRQICFAFAGFSILGLCLCFFRKDKLNLHDIITHSAAVQRSEE